MRPCVSGHLALVRYMRMHILRFIYCVSKSSTHGMAYLAGRLFLLIRHGHSNETAVSTFKQSSCTHAFSDHVFIPRTYTFLKFHSSVLRLQRQCPASAYSCIYGMVSCEEIYARLAKIMGEQGF
jgi:hypothetical protein